MNLSQAIAIINQFRAPDKQFNSTFDNSFCVQLIRENNKNCERNSALVFPPELTAYIDTFCPLNNMSMQSVGNPIELITRSRLSWQLPGYNSDAITNEPLMQWQPSWFLIASEGGEPIIVDISENQATSTVYSSIQATDSWEFCPIADSIAQFLLCAAAVEYALNFPGIDEPLDDDFNLVDEAAQWFFPFIKLHAEKYYDEWASVFENY